MILMRLPSKEVFEIQHPLKIYNDTQVHEPNKSKINSGIPASLETMGLHPQTDFILRKKSILIEESFSLQYRIDPDLPSPAHWAVPPLVQSEESHL